MQDTSGCMSGWCSLRRSCFVGPCVAELEPGRAGLGDSDFRVLEVLLHKGTLPVNTIGPKVWLNPDRSVSQLTDWRRKRW